ncbi:MAG: hypothetical protein ACYDEH_10810 [Acidimicrobiales bacterium]
MSDLRVGGELRPVDVRARVAVRPVATSTTARSPSAGGEARPPIHWPSLGPFDAQREWPELRAWVDAMRERYRGLDSYVVPACWFEHESIVVALQALRDHERVAYDTTSPGSSGTDWHRAYRDVTAMLRQFTADLRCGHGPEYADGELFEEFVTNDIARRRRRAATVALSE